MREYYIARKFRGEVYYLHDAEIDEGDDNVGEFIWKTTKTNGCPTRKIVEELCDALKSCRPDLDVQVVGEEVDEDFLMKETILF